VHVSQNLNQVFTICNENETSTWYNYFHYSQSLNRYREAPFGCDAA
jgi:hypothetical protein